MFIQSYPQHVRQYLTEKMFIDSNLYAFLFMVGWRQAKPWFDFYEKKDIMLTGSSPACQGRIWNLEKWLNTCPILWQLGNQRMGHVYLTSFPNSRSVPV